MARSTPPKDVPGDSVQSAANYQRFLVRLAENLLDMERLVERMDGDEVFLRSITIRLPGLGEGDYLAVIRAEGPAGRVVAFHGAPTFHETVAGLLERIRNDSLKWKEDQYAK